MVGRGAVQKSEDLITAFADNVVLMTSSTGLQHSLDWMQPSVKRLG